MSHVVVFYTRIGFADGPILRTGEVLLSVQVPLSVTRRNNNTLQLQEAGERDHNQTKICSFVQVVTLGY
jgi:hypothetical protein